MNPFERSHCTNLFFLSRSSCQIGIAGGSPAYTTISISSRPVFGPARKSRNFNQSKPRPTVRTELPTFDSSTSIKTLDRVVGLFFRIISAFPRFSFQRLRVASSSQLLNYRLSGQCSPTEPTDGPTDLPRM